MIFESQQNCPLGLNLYLRLLCLWDGHFVVHGITCEILLMMALGHLLCSFFGGNSHFLET